MDHMEFSIALPLNTDSTKAGAEWANMKERMNTHKKRLNFSEELNQEFLLSIATSTQVSVIYRQLSVCLSELPKFNLILRYIESVCLPRFIITYNRFKFFTCRQKDSFDMFLYQLLTLSELCEFGDLQDILLKDCIITGISDNALRQHLLRTEELDFNKTVEICKAFEKRKREMVDVGVNTELTLIDASTNTSNSTTNTTHFKTSSSQTQELSNSFCEVAELDYESDNITSEVSYINNQKPKEPFLNIQLSSLETAEVDNKVFSLKKKEDNISKDDLNLGHEKSKSCPEQTQEFVSASEMNTSSLMQIKQDKMNPKRKFHCVTCSSSFVYFSHLRVHIRSHTGERPFTCTKCSKTFSEASKLKVHLRIHNKEWPFNCKVCNRPFRYLSSLKRHTRIHSGDRPYICQICKADFVDSTTLMRHLWIHSSKKPFACDKCPSTFITSRDLLLHKRTHTGDKPYSCKICKKRFARIQNLKAHLKFHSGERPFTCKECGAKFADASKLKSHRRKHTGEKPYVCKVCDMSFSWSAALYRHKQTHTRERPYFCETCGRSFADSNTLRRHCRTHTGEKPYKCDICPREFADSSSLKRHSNIHEGLKILVCEICGSTFNTSSNLTRHKKIHTGDKPYSCSTCGNRFAQAHNLKRHKKIHEKLSGPVGISRHSSKFVSQPSNKNMNTIKQFYTNADVPSNNQIRSACNSQHFKLLESSQISHNTIKNNLSNVRNNEADQMKSSVIQRTSQNHSYFHTASNQAIQRNAMNLDHQSYHSQLTSQISFDINSHVPIVEHSNSFHPS